MLLFVALIDYNDVVELKNQPRLDVHVGCATINLSGL